MRRFILHPVILFGALLVAPELTSAESGVNARDVMEHNFVASKVSAFNGSVSIVLTTAQGQERVRKLKMWSRLKDKSTDSGGLVRGSWAARDADRQAARSCRQL